MAKLEPPDPARLAMLALPDSVGLVMPMRLDFKLATEPNSTRLAMLAPPNSVGLAMAMGLVFKLT